MITDKNQLLAELNESQRAAVEYTDGPSIVIAGAGSGKTRVLTYKIAYLMKMGVKASTILALTFTNKAAREMRERIGQLVGEREARYLWMGTFHSIFARILRLEAERVGYTTNFTIYDTADSKSLIKTILKQMQLDEKTYKPSSVLGAISDAKNRLISPQQYAQDSDAREMNRFRRTPLMPDIYREYVLRCRKANAMDFDDLLYYTNILLRDNPDVLRTYQERFRYLLVDEYQDTNFAQYLIVKKLAALHENICVVGDDAQSIYSFRGANIRNILSFQQTYPNSRLFKLERNYRSTQNIVNAANSLISANRDQIPKTIYSEKEAGEPLHVISTFTDIEEADRVTAEIARLHNNNRIGYDHVAILYRTNSQSRVLENSLRSEGVPYRIYGGHSFYERKEIKDALAYMRLVVNEDDDEALKRIINVPARGIGATTLAKVLEQAQSSQTSAWQVLNDPRLQVNEGTRKKLQGFATLINGFRKVATEMDAYQTADLIIKQSGLAAEALAENTSEGMSRHENLMEMLSGIHELQERRADSGETQELQLTDYLGEVALLTDMDNSDDDSPKVTLMTIHAAKGLEFDVVFAVGLEEGLFPSTMAETDSEIEEERRLFYVAITRAKQQCYLTYAQSRFRNGKTNFSTPTRFFDDIDEVYLDHPPVKKQAVNDFSYDFEEEQRNWFAPPTASGNSWKRSPGFSGSTYSRSNTAPGRSLSKLGGSYSRDPNAAVDIECGYPAGTRVSHGVFGTGTVERTYMENANQKIDINFDTVGHKSLLIKFAKLTIIN